MTKQQTLDRILEQLKCICAQHGIEFMFVGGIVINETEQYQTIHLDGDCNLAKFLGESGRRLLVDQPIFFQMIIDEFNNPK